MSNQITSNLPADVDKVLMDFAQIFESESGDSLNYTNIIDWAARAKAQDIKEMRIKIADLADLDFMYDEDADAMYIAEDIVRTVKGETLC